tara:strand:- start:264 stop:503 length:240 start_codon:yes stop_codon:yes gene_type:complete
VTRFGAGVIELGTQDRFSKISTFKGYNSVLCFNFFREKYTHTIGRIAVIWGNHDIFVVILVFFCNGSSSKELKVGFKAL